MKKVYHVSELWRESDVAFLASLGIERKVKTIDPILIEEGEIFSKIRDYISERNSNFYEDYYFEYTKSEILQSKYCVLDKQMHYSCGYPEHLELTYNLKESCRTCAFDERQIEDFRISKVAKHKLWGFFAWVDEALFAEESFYREVFEPLGIKCRTVRTKGGKIIEGLVQLIIPEIDENLKYPNFAIRVCPQCGNKKYYGRQLFPFYPLHNNPLPHIYLTKDRFGCQPKDSHPLIYISTELALRLINLKQLKYEWLAPCIPQYEEFLINNYNTRESVPWEGVDAGISWMMME